MKAHLGRIKLALISIGVLLAVASLFDFSGLAQRAYWSEEEADQLQNASVEYKRLNYETPGSSGHTAEEIAQQRQRAKQRFDSLRAQLDNASNAPQQWRHMLLVSAVVCLGAGLACHFSDQAER